MASKESFAKNIAIYGLVLSNFIPLYSPDGVQTNTQALLLHTKDIAPLTVENAGIMPEEIKNEEPKRLQIKPASEPKIRPNL